MMHGQALAREVIGVIGDVISFVLFAAPIPTYIRISKKKSTDEFHPYPYLAALINCMFWIFYGMHWVHPDSLLVVIINSVGLGLELIYLAIFFIYTSTKYRKVIGLVLLGEIALVASVAAFTLTCFHTHTKRSEVVGIICDIFGIIMYASPLSILLKVFKTKSTEFMPFWLCVAGFANGLMWTLYACLKSFDLYILIGNGVGGLFALFQLCVFAYYYYYYGAKKDVKSAELPLQKVATIV